MSRRLAKNRSLVRLLRALRRSTLFRLVREYDVSSGRRHPTKEDLVALLAAQPQADPEEIVTHLLRWEELTLVCRVLGRSMLRPVGPAPQESNLEAD